MYRICSGFVWTAIAVLAGIGSLTAYIVNCNTEYFSVFGIDIKVVGCLAAGTVLAAAVLIIAIFNTAQWTDIFPVLASGFFSAATAFLIGVRINEIAFIMTFQKNADTVADMKSAVLSIVLSLAAVVVSCIASFFEVRKNTEQRM